ncbi:MAG: S8 family serine peptidase, partial [Bacteroidales bacterium]|nr:S8 family serine peptidase [Bacteroidales bacterium]
KRLRNEGRILGAKNFYHQEECIFRNGNHGEMVLSCIAAYKKGSFIGTAPDAYFYLAKTEDGQSENIIEEDNWVAGIEWADSLGVDVLNSSLGYTQFDDDTMGHPRTIEMLNGQTSRASKAATLAVQRGMIVCNSAGNSGAKSWHRIGTPADAKDILTVGATFINGNHANFSSFGPTSDGRVKPDACAAGAFVPVFKTDGKIGNASGTSFASPYLAGMTASLWQAFPEKSNYEIMDAIRKSGSQYNQPDSTLGYGVTDFMKAYNILYDNDLIETQVILQDYVIPYDKKYRYTLHINIYSAHKQSVTLKAQSRISGTEIILTQTIPAGKKKINLPLGKATSQYDIADLEIQTENGTRKFVIGLEEIKKEGE